MPNSSETMELAILRAPIPMTARLYERQFETPISSSNVSIGARVTHAKKKPQDRNYRNFANAIKNRIDTEYADIGSGYLVAVHCSSGGKLPQVPRGPRKGTNLKRCLVCGYTTPFNQRMEYHQRIHTGERPYKCQYCHKDFRQVAHLNGHIRIHTGERPFQCHLCPMTFAQKGKLKRHLKKH
ncbi:hypothetical protein HPB51_000206 [Rhipicephalus microplus]|uniref:C2H2-type domain-containing protein n=1 Tax=Rhipicephalus microplus TaxID=6941 RepID=A0A9J6E4I4_RHIMP|nr:hypothetical protein HPB51_000206 [Rhipicephalus microplus]